MIRVDPVAKSSHNLLFMMCIGNYFLVAYQRHLLIVAGIW
jgi:hypothetical protein